MGFLIRMTFWFSLVLLALPLKGAGDGNGQHQVNAVEAIIAAGEAVSDIAGICERKPDVCETGKSAIATIGVRAREVSRIAYETFEDEPEETDSTATGSVPVPSEPVPPAPAPAD